MPAIATFTKDGHTKTAYSQAEVVQLRFAGWTETGLEDPAGATPAGDVPAPPPMAGHGSDTEAWAGYAAKLGVDIEQDAKRADIVAAIKAAGHPTEPATE